MDKLEGLKEYQANSKQETFDKVTAAIDNLKRGKKKITYKLVAKAAGVSEQTLYKNEVLKEKIKQAQAIQSSKNNQTDEKPIKFISEKDKKIMELKEQIQKYKEELMKEKGINSLLLGNLEKKTSEALELKIRINSLKDNLKKF